MGVEEFIGLSPATDSETDYARNNNFDTEHSEIRKSSSCDEINDVPTNGFVVEADIDTEQVTRDGSETTSINSVKEKSASVAENGCAVVDGNGSTSGWNTPVKIANEKHSLGMELDKNIVINTEQASGDCIETTATSSVAEKIDVIQQSVAVEDDLAAALDVRTPSNHVTDESPISGVKRARMTYIDQEPCVHVVYNSLTRESLKKLKECLQEWSHWHARHETSAQEKDILEHGEETYFPALHVGEQRSSIVTFWVDSQPRKSESKEYTPTDNESAPLYDRGYVLGSNSIDGSANLERLESLEASRCFNCGSYSHSLKECPRPRDNVAINSARKQHSSKKPPNTGARGQSRYYLSSPGRFDDLKAGFLGLETRQCLGIGELDPPPWFQRMREFGYPPGYLDGKEDEDQPSGITIFTDEEITVEQEEGELADGGEPGAPEEKNSVNFPVINAPIPDYANRQQWVESSPNASSLDTWRRYHQNSSSPAEVHRSHNQDQRRSRENSERGHHVSENLPSSSNLAYPSRYGPYDRSPIPRSPSLSRSQSDRAWRSPMGGFEGSPGYGYQTPSHYSSRDSPQHYTPISSDRWDPHANYHGSSNSSSHGKDRDRYRHR